MKDDKHPVSESRRRFLRDAGAAGGAAALAATVPGTAAAAPADDTGNETAAQDGYRLSQHILDYYKTAAS